MPRSFYGSVVVVVLDVGQVVVEPWQRHGSGSPKHPTPISKQLKPNGHEPPQTPRRGVLRFLLVAARSMNGDAPAYAVAWHSSLLLLF